MQEQTRKYDVFIAEIKEIQEAINILISHADLKTRVKQELQNISDELTKAKSHAVHINTLIRLEAQTIYDRCINAINYLKTTIVQEKGYPVGELNRVCSYLEDIITKVSPKIELHTYSVTQMQEVQAQGLFFTQRFLNNMLTELSPLGKDFKALLETIKTTMGSNRYSCFISYIKPIDKTNGPEQFIQSFLETLRDHLLLAGFNPLLDFKCIEPGENVEAYMKNVLICNYWLLIGTPSLTRSLDQHAYINFETSMENIRKVNKLNDIYPMIPLLVIGNATQSLPWHKQSHNTIDLTQSSYLAGLKKLLQALSRIPEQTYNDLWKPFEAKYPEHMQALSSTLIGQILQAEQQKKQLTNTQLENEQIDAYRKFSQPILDTSNKEKKEIIEIKSDVKNILSNQQMNQPTMLEAANKNSTSSFNSTQLNISPIENSQSKFAKIAKEMLDIYGVDTWKEKDKKKKVEDAINKDIKTLTQKASKVEIYDVRKKFRSTIYGKIYNDNKTAELLKAVNNGESDKIRDLLKEGANVNANEHNIFLKSFSLLHIATKKGYEDIVDILIKAGADINNDDSYGRTPLLVAIFKLAEKGIHKCKNIIKLLIDAGADVNTVSKRWCYKIKTIRGKKDHQEWAPLHLAAYYSFNGDPRLVKYLLKRGANPELFTDDKQTALAIAQERKYNEIVDVLVNYRSSKLAKGASNMNEPLQQQVFVNPSFEQKAHVAEKKQLTTTFIERELFEASPEKLADVFQLVFTNEISKLNKTLHEQEELKAESDSHNNSLLHYAAFLNVDVSKDSLLYELMNEENQYGLQPLHIAAYFGRTRLVEQLLAEGAFPNRNHKHVTLQVGQFKIACNALHLAVLSGQMETVEQLLKKADIHDSLQVKGIGNILHLAVLSRNPVMLKTLMNHEIILAIKELDPYNELDAKDFTPLSLAVHIANKSALHILLRHARVKPNTYSKKGYTVLHFAVEAQVGWAIRTILGTLGQQQGVYELLNSATNDLQRRTAYQLAIDLSQHAEPNSREQKLYKSIAQLLDSKNDQTRQKLRQDINYSRPVIRNLVLQGGGPKGIAYVGALGQLDSILSQHDSSLGEIQRVAGASAGAITALFLALNFSPLNMLDVLGNLNMGSLLDKIDADKLKAFLHQGEVILQSDSPQSEATGLVLDLIKEAYGLSNKAAAGYQLFMHRQRIWDDFLQLKGLCSGETLVEWLRTAIHQKLKDDKIAERFGNKYVEKDLTFGMLAELIEKDAGYKHLYVVATCITGQKPEIVQMNSEDCLDAKNQCPWWDVSLVDGVRASMSIPGVYKPHVINGKEYLDGGILMNYPIKIFDKVKYVKRYMTGDDQYELFNEETLGLRLVDPEINKDKALATIQASNTTTLDMMKQLMSAYYIAQDLIAEFEQKNHYRSIAISNMGVGLLDFDLSEDKKNQLLVSGADTVKQFFHMFLEEPPATLATANTNQTPKQRLQGLKLLVADESATHITSHAQILSNIGVLKNNNNQVTASSLKQTEKIEEESNTNAPK